MTSLRDAIVANALWGADNEHEIHYSQGAHRYDALHAPRYLPLYTDCSAFVTLCYAWAAAPDPNGLGYNGTGFTGTLLDHLDEIPLGDAQPADLIVYGPGAGDHVVVVVEPGADPWTVSHGQEAGPIRVRHSIEARAHRAPVRVLRGLPADAPTPDPQPTPAPTPARRDQPMTVFRLQSQEDEKSDAYHVYMGVTPDGPRWSIIHGADQAWKVAANNGQTKLEVISDDTYHALGGN